MDWKRRANPSGKFAERQARPRIGLPCRFSQTAQRHTKSRIGLPCRFSQTAERHTKSRIGLPCGVPALLSTLSKTILLSFLSLAIFCPPARSAEPAKSPLSQAPSIRAGADGLADLAARGKDETVRADARKALLRAYQEVGYEHMIAPDHYPRIPGDTAWGHQSRAYAVGYIKALITAAGGETD